LLPDWFGTGYFVRFIFGFLGDFGFPFLDFSGQFLAVRFSFTAFTGRQVFWGFFWFCLVLFWGFVLGFCFSLKIHLNPSGMGLSVFLSCSFLYLFSAPVPCFL